MTKRKRNGNADVSSTSRDSSTKKKIKAAEAPTTSADGGSTCTIQIVTGSYDRVLHGITATISAENKIEFADTFLFNAHTSAIRCLALSPPSAPVPGQTQKVILATGSTDERINLYHLSAHTPRKSNQPAFPSLTCKPILENTQNKELGSLLHHAASITALHFPTRSKLLSSAEDCTMAVTRSRDWSLLCMIKAPMPKPQGRPSGDTAPPGGTPAGVNDFAVHPSLKLMISVGKGEKCMRLWNLVTGKKAGVLSFARDMLGQVGEGKHGSGEGRSVAWGSTDVGGEEFSVGFERGVLVFGMDSRPRCRAVPEPPTKIHRLCYILTSNDDESMVLAVSTEDGRIVFYATGPDSVAAAPATDDAPLPLARPIAQLGGRASGVSGRIKDFTVLKRGTASSLVILGGSSDGSLRLWQLHTAELQGGDDAAGARQVGTLLGTYNTGHRITCLGAFVMVPGPEGGADATADADKVAIVT